MGKELNLVKTTAVVAGISCEPIQLKLLQAFNSHHTFEIDVDFDKLDDLWMGNPIQIIQLMGKDVEITMEHIQTGEQNLFKGIVTHVEMKGVHGQQNYYRISGCSPTIRLEGSPAMDSFMDLTLDSIVQEAVANSGNGGEVTAKSKYKTPIDYICQYNETAFQFVNRLSFFYGEWWLYDGLKSYFGKPDLGGEPAVVTYDEEMTHLDVEANLVPPMVNRYHYLVHDDKEIQNDTPAMVPGVRGYIQVALNESKSVYTSETTVPLSPLVATKKDLEDMTKVEKYRMVSHMFQVKGRTQTCKIKIGRKVKIKLPDTMEVSPKEVETFLVTEVNHYMHQDGTYYNTFKGIPGDMENIPMEPVKEPLANPQVGWVKSNQDARKLGRVKVEFQWQKKKNKTTNWIRVQTTDAGKSDRVPHNRGLVTVPEEGDLIMCGFEYGDPNRPYVSGSIFSEQVSRGGKETNKIKSYTTRVGSTVTFDDQAHTIEISTSGKNKIFIEEKKGAITVTAASSITLNAGQTIDLNAPRITFSGKESVTTRSPKIEIGQASGDLANLTIDLAGKNIEADGSNHIYLEGGGATIKMEGGQIREN